MSYSHYYLFMFLNTYLNILFLLLHCWLNLILLFILYFIYLAFCYQYQLVFLTFNLSPYMLQVLLILSMVLCKWAKIPARITVSSAYLGLLMNYPFILISMCPWKITSSTIVSLYKLNNKWDRTQPFITPYLIFIYKTYRPL